MRACAPEPGDGLVRILKEREDLVPPEGWSVAVAAGVLSWTVFLQLTVMDAALLFSRS